MTKELTVDEIATKFWSRVEKGNGCWLWAGKLNPKGYGACCVILYGKRIDKAHRVALTLTLGRTLPPWPMVVMHSCDNRRCVNPAHLSLGTQTENVADQDRKGGKHRARGERHGRAKLTEDDVRTIRQSAEPTSVLARRYGVHYTTAAKARDGRFWPHVK